VNPAEGKFAVMLDAGDDGQAFLAAIRILPLNSLSSRIVDANANAVCPHLQRKPG
jgi:hypothetical protein